MTVPVEAEVDDSNDELDHDLTHGAPAGRFAQRLKDLTETAAGLGKPGGDEAADSPAGLAVSGGSRPT